MLSYSDITTIGDGAHGIVAQNQIGVYHPWSVLSLGGFSEDDVETRLTSVSGSSVHIGTSVAGDDGGLFTLYADGTWDFDASDMNDVLAVRETVVTKVDYQIEIEHEPGSFMPLLPYGSQFSAGSLAVRVTKNDITIQYTHTLLKRMHSTRSHIESADAGLAYSQTDERAVWVDGFGHWAKQDSQDGFCWL